MRSGVHARGSLYFVAAGSTIEVSKEQPIDFILATIDRQKAARLFEDLSPPRPRLDPLSRLLRRAPARRERGAGRPTKRERRRLDRWRRD